MLLVPSEPPHKTYLLKQYTQIFGSIIKHKDKTYFLPLSPQFILYSGLKAFQNKGTRSQKIF